ncbi:MAG: cell envelope integrity protein CreD [Opitutae bacterium]|nr:cell envelope integrity protein CreD [Opitutae bacterium]
MNAQPPVIPTPASRRLAVFLKLASIGLLLLLLQIPLFMTRGVLTERQGYQRQATQEIAALWGRQQQVTGPVLAIPYEYRALVTRTREVNGRAVQVDEWTRCEATAYFLPETLAADGEVETEVRHRGIYDAAVYATRLKLQGEFRPDFAGAGIENEAVHWERARVMLGISDLRGLRSVTPLGRPGGRAAAFETTDGKTAGEFPLAAAVGLAAGEAVPFTLELALQGSEQLAVAPTGKQTRAALHAAWADPSFVGAYLPVKRTIAPAGFTAEWEVSHFSRGFPQSWTDRTANTPEVLRKIDAAGFGVRFVRPIDGYGMVERARKYGVLFFVLVFAVFFLFEVTAGRRIHPLQYAMVGAALCLFFLGFLALSEFLATGAAYGIAAAACTALVALYAWSFLGSGGRTLVIGGGLAATYGYLYFVLQSQDYARVAGTLALFAALALVMFCTRRINWYSLEMNAAAAPAAGNR